MKNAATLRDISVITIFAFLLNVTLPFFASYNLATFNDLKNSNSTASELIEMFGEKILVCTTNGYEWVNVKDMFDDSIDNTIDENLIDLGSSSKLSQHASSDSNPPSAPASHQFKCPLCFLNSQGISVAIPSLEIAINYPQKTQSISYSVNNVFAFSQLSAHQPQTRGPPDIV